MTIFYVFQLLERWSAPFNEGGAVNKAFCARCKILNFPSPASALINDEILKILYLFHSLDMSLIIHISRFHYRLCIFWLRVVNFMPLNVLHRTRVPHLPHCCYGFDWSHCLTCVRGVRISLVELRTCLMQSSLVLCPSEVGARHGRALNDFARSELDSALKNFSQFHVWMTRSTFCLKFRTVSARLT
jgi:hypothetical protein